MSEYTSKDYLNKNLRKLGGTITLDSIITKSIDDAVHQAISQKQEKLFRYLNDNMVEPTEHIKGIAEILNIEFIDTEEQHGWAWH